MLIIAVNGYVIAAPSMPAAIFHLADHTGKQQQLTNDLHVKQPPTMPQPSNQLIIPSMLLKQPTLEGPIANQYKILNNGIWRWPASSTPDKGGNTVLIGHRFTYANPQGVFYHLDKIKPGDEIGIFWNGKKYLYKTISITQVAPTDTSIQNQTAEARLTLFTCAPLWLPKNRLVVVAHLEAGR